MTARTLRQGEFVALKHWPAPTPPNSTKRCSSVDRFVRPDSPLPVDAPIRAQLLERFGMFGIRISIAVLAAGVADATSLAAELLERSGLVALRDVIDQQFAQRSDMLKAHTALVSLRRFVEAHPVMATPYVIADIDPLLADTHAFEELRLLSLLSSRTTTLKEEEISALRRIVGGSGTNPASRLSLDPAASRADPQRSRARRSLRRKVGAAAPSIRSTTRSQLGRAVQQCEAPRRYWPNFPRVADGLVPCRLASV